MTVLKESKTLAIKSQRTQIPLSLALLPVMPSFRGQHSMEWERVPPARAEQAALQRSTTLLTGLNVSEIATFRGPPCPLICFHLPISKATSERSMIILKVERKMYFSTDFDGWLDLRKTVTD